MYRQTSSKNWSFKVVFEILLDKADVSLLYVIKDYFGVGKIYLGNKTAVYRVRSVKELGSIIAHFAKYPLCSPKMIAYKYWCEVVSLLITSEHLKSTSTFNYIRTIYAALGRGTSKAVSLAFPNLNPIALPEYNLPLTVDTISPWWLNGYLTLYCSFVLTLEAKGWKNEIYNKYRTRFRVSIDGSYSELAKVIADFLGLSYYVRKDGRVEVMAQSIEQALAVIQFFDQYPLQSYKQNHYLIYRDGRLTLSEKTQLFPNPTLIHRRFIELIDKLTLLKCTR